jgi:hypothetical protein
MPHKPIDRTFASYQTYWEQLGALATGALDALNLHLDEHPDDAATWSLHRGLLTAL